MVMIMNGYLAHCTKIPIFVQKLISYITYFNICKIRLTLVVSHLNNWFSEFLDEKRTFGTVCNLYQIRTLSITASSDLTSDGRYNVSFNGKALLASLETNYMNLVPKSCDEKSLSKPLQKEALRRKYSFIWTKELSTKMEHKLSMNDLQTFLIAVHMNEFIY